MHEPVSTLVTASWDGTVGVWETAPVAHSTAYSLTLRCRLDITTGRISACLPNGTQSFTLTAPQESKVATPFNVVVGMSSVAQLTRDMPRAATVSSNTTPSFVGLGEWNDVSTCADDLALYRALFDAPFSAPGGEGQGVAPASTTDTSSTSPPAPAFLAPPTSTTPSPLAHVSASAPASAPASTSASTPVSSPASASASASVPASAPASAAAPAAAPAPTATVMAPASTSASSYTRTARPSAAAPPTPSRSALGPSASSRAPRVWGVDVNSNWIIAGGDRPDVLVWDVRTLELKHVLHGHGDTVYCVRLIGGGRAATAGADETIRIWDLVSGRCQAILTEHEDIIMSLTSVGDVLVSGSADATVRVWSVSKILGQGPRVSPPSSFVLVGHCSTVYSVAVDQQLPLLVSGSHDGELRLWNVRNGRCIGLVKPFGVSSRGSNSVAILDLQIVPIHGRRSIVACCRNGTVRALDVQTRCTPTLSIAFGVGKARSAALVGSNRLVTGTSSGKLRVIRALP